VTRSQPEGKRTSVKIPTHKSSKKQAATHCRRRADRSAYEASVALAVMRGDEFGKPVVVQATDISVSGIGIVTRQMMHEGTVGALHLLMPDDGTTVVGVEVMNCQYIGEMNHRIGLRFTELHPKYTASPNMPGKCRVIESKHAHKTFRKSVRR
jgi:hypothetical protein